MDRKNNNFIVYSIFVGVIVAFLMSNHGVSVFGQDAKVWDAVADLLTNWQFLEAKAEADPNFQEQDSVEPSPATEEPKP